jgi:serine/threonine-protein kinase
MGVVYKARHKTLGRLVALKMMLPKFLSRPQEAQRFEHEMQAVARLNDPNIVPIYEVGQHEGQPYFTMAFLSGGTLARQRERLFDQPREAVTIMAKVGRAMQSAHAQNIVHRDLKPGNVLLDERGEPYISDFGLAKLEDTDDELTETGAVLGTPAYMSPEQAAGRSKDLDATTDVWALGVMLYELLTGKRPFSGASSDEVKRRILTEDPLPPRVARPGLDRDLQAILLKCLDKEPTRRYPMAGALTEDLEAYLRGDPIRARLPSPPARLWRVVRRHPWVSTALVLVGVLAVVLAVVRHYTDPDLPVKRARERLARGETETLIGDSGPPQWGRWILGEGGTGPSRRKDGTYYIHAHDPAFQELLQEPLPPRYWLRAQVNNPDYEFGTAGVYFAHRRRQTTHGAEHCYFLLTINNDVDRTWRLRSNGDRFLERRAQIGAVLAFSPSSPLSALTALGLPPQPIPTIGEVRLSICRTPEPGNSTGSSYVGTMGISKRFDSTPGKHGNLWHDLAIRVTPEQIEIYRDGECLGTASRSFIIQRAGFVLAANAELDPKAEFAPEGGLGLYIRQGGASFRQVQVEPLKEGG